MNCPRITVFDDKQIQITFPDDRTYGGEIIEFMESRGYVLTGGGRCFKTSERDLVFKEKK